MRLPQHAKPVLTALLLGLLLCGTTAADDALMGGWSLTDVGGQEPGDGQHLRFVFDEDTVTVTAEASGEELTWALGYSVSEGTLTIEPGTGLGTPNPMVYTYRIESDRLLLENEGLGEVMTFVRIAQQRFLLSAWPGLHRCPPAIACVLASRLVPRHLRFAAVQPLAESSSNDADI